MQGLSAGLTIAERFTLVRRLGGGGMGEVWLADDQELTGQVALKLLDPNCAQIPGFVDLLRRECSRARSLVHPNIVRVFDFHAGDDRVFISMQFVDGETLVARRGIAFQDIVHLALMVCDALAYAHREDVIHRDVKSSNVLVDGNGVCYLTDFGIAGVASPGTGSDDTAPRGGGTLPSMSPQQLAGQPPAISDDVYALGALLYELLSGAPLFHPDVTPERIRAEAAPPLTVDGTGQPLPDALSKLVAAMLAKAPEQRPAGIGAVRSVLEEIRADYPVAEPESGDDDEVIRPISRRRATPTAAPSGVTEPPRRRVDDQGRGLPPALVYGGLAALLAMVMVVVFFLPGAVEDRREAEQAVAAEEPEPAATADDDAAATARDAVTQSVRREIADELLGELLVIQDRLNAVGVSVWGGADWAEAEDHVGTGDEAYQGRQYDAAVDAYRAALNLMKVLEPRAPEVLASALAAGAAAIEAGNQPLAVEQFELALVVDPVNQVARAGLERAERLDEVLELTREGAIAEESGDLNAAADFYERALAIDANWSPAREGLSRSRAGVAQVGYERRMAAGFSALSREEFDAARREFEAALVVKPGDADAQAALRQVDTEARLADVIRLQALARIAEVGEDWDKAVGHYEAILALDPAVTSAQQNLERARSRQQLGERLERTIAKADEFNDERIAADARGVLARARAVESPGKVLQGQAERLEELLRIASVPVPVEFRSDNLTEVVIYKVGSLGTFQSRTLDLKPWALRSGRQPSGLP